MLPSDIAHLESIARRGFSYQPDFADTPAQNHWRSFADAALDGKVWAGNCDCLTSTMLDLLTRAGLLLADAYMLAVKAYDSGKDHMVGCAVDGQEMVWIVGDTYAAAPYRAESLRHLPNIYHRLNEPVTEWRQGVPWALEG